MDEDMGLEGKNNGRNKRICGGERDNEISGRSMDRKTKELCFFTLIVLQVTYHNK